MKRIQWSQVLFSPTLSPAFSSFCLPIPLPISADAAKTLITLASDRFTHRESGNNEPHSSGRKQVVGRERDAGFHRPTYWQTTPSWSKREFRKLLILQHFHRVTRWDRAS